MAIILVVTGGCLRRCDHWCGLSLCHILVNRGSAVCRAWDAASGLQYDHSLGNSDDLRQFKNHRSLVSPINALGVCIALDLWRFGGCCRLGAGDEWLACLC